MAEAPVASAAYASESEDSKRISVIFSGDIYKALQDLTKSGKSMSDVIKDAITLEKWISDARKDGYRVLLEKDGKVKELMLR